jgi:hypothetical protein
MTATDLIRLLDLAPHPEGGFYRETWRADEHVVKGALPARYDGPRGLGTAIYYLLTTDAFSALHRLRSDELFHFYAGDPVEIVLLWPDGRGEVRTLGGDLDAGVEPQLLVPRGVWQGARPRAGGPAGYSLLGTTVAPGFEFADYEPGRRAALVAAYPGFAELCAALTRE